MTNSHYRGQPRSTEILAAAFDGYFPGHVHVSDEAAGLAYSKAVEGCLSGETIVVELLALSSTQI